jgi:hypothetical protein
MSNQGRALPKVKKKKITSTTIRQWNCWPETGFNFEGFPSRKVVTASGRNTRQNLNKNKNN